MQTGRKDAEGKAASKDRKDDFGWSTEMAALRDAMEGVRFDRPIPGAPIDLKATERRISESIRKASRRFADGRRP